LSLIDVVVGRWSPQLHSIFTLSFGTHLAGLLISCCFVGRAVSSGDLSWLHGEPFLCWCRLVRLKEQSSVFKEICSKCVAVKEADLFLLVQAEVEAGVRTLRVLRLQA